MSKLQRTLISIATLTAVAFIYQTANAAYVKQSYASSIIVTDDISYVFDSDKSGKDVAGAQAYVNKKAKGDVIVQLNSSNIVMKALQTKANMSTGFYAWANDPSATHKLNVKIGGADTQHVTLHGEGGKFSAGILLKGEGEKNGFISELRGTRP